jgi:hypothetical protein
MNDAHAADSVLARLEAERMHPHNTRALAIFDVTNDANAKRTTGDGLLDAGFRYLGTSMEHPKGGTGDLCDAFIDADDTTYVVVRRSRTVLPLSRYYIVTTFDDSTCVESVSQKNPTQPTEPRLTMRGGTNDVVRDAKDHLAFVRERVARGAKVIPLRNLDDIARIKRFYISHVISPQQATMIANVSSTKLKAMILSVGTLLFIAYQIWRWLRR